MRRSVNEILKGKEAMNTKETMKVKRLRIAAESGNPEAQCALATCYAHGNGVCEDLTQMATWFKKAAKQNYPEGQFWLAASYYCGQGVPFNEACAVKWLTRAADKGYEKARNLLSEIIVSQEGQ
jgi:uncharacterized protein